jgi:RNA polymerase sigma-70 factor (ECF subfamily)
MVMNDPVKDEGTVQGESRSFEELFKLHSGRVYSVCLRMTGSTTEAEDLSQEVFVQVFRKLDTFRGESSFTTWLHRLTVNHVLMYFRKTRRRLEHLTEDGEMPELPIKGRDVLISMPLLDRLALDEAIVQLSPGYRAVFLLHDVEGLQHTEIAQILGCSVGTSKSQLHKARLKMRCLLRQRSHRSQTVATSPGINRKLKGLATSHPPLQSILSPTN